jgi:4-hydroxybenzoate polyprenyltransferase
VPQLDPVLGRLGARARHRDSVGAFLRRQPGRIGLARVEVDREVLRGLGDEGSIGAGVVLALLVYEHSIVRPSDLSRVDVAFFNLNGYVSLAYFAATLAEVLTG